MLVNYCSIRGGEFRVLANRVSFVVAIAPRREHSVHHIFGIIEEEDVIVVESVIRSKYVRCA